MIEFYSEKLWYEKCRKPSKFNSLMISANNQKTIWNILYITIKQINIKEYIE